MPRWIALDYCVVNDVLRRPGDIFDASEGDAGILPERGLLTEHAEDQEPEASDETGGQEGAPLLAAKPSGPAASDHQEA